MGGAINTVTSSVTTRAAGSERGGVLLVGNLPEGPLVGGVEVGVEMILNSDLPSQHGLRLFNTARRRDPSRPLRERLGYQLRRSLELFTQVLRMRPRLVHVKATVGVNYWQGASYCLIARLCGRRVLLQLHGGDLDSWYSGFGPIVRAAMRMALRLPSEIMVLSEYWREFIDGLVPGRSIHVVPNGVRLELARPRHQADNELLEVVSVGALGERKGHFEILEAAARLRDRPIRFIFAGEDEFGGEQEALSARATELGVSNRVEFAGAVTGPDKWELLAKSDVFLLPSRGENMPNSLLEAMAAGLPVVCTEVGAVPEMVDTGAIFVPVGDGEAIAKVLSKLVGSPREREKMGADNRKRAEQRYGFSVVAAALDRIYRQGAA